MFQDYQCENCNAVGTVKVEDYKITNLTKNGDNYTATLQAWAYCTKCDDDIRFWVPVTIIPQKVERP